jgi:hypothetical protein
MSLKVINVTAVPNIVQVQPLANPISGNLLNSTCGCFQMAVTIAVFTKNMRVSRRWEYEHVGYRIRVQTPLKFTLLESLNLRIHPYVQSVQISLAPCPVFKNP